MEFNADTHLIEVLDRYPWLAEVLPQMDARFAVMNTAAGKLMLRRFTVRDLSRISGHAVDELLRELQTTIQQHEE